MKKILLIIGICVLAFFACKKDIELLHETVPTVLTDGCEEVTASSAKLYGELKSTGVGVGSGLGIGFYYSTEHTPTSSDKYIIAKYKYGEELFTATLTELSENTTYYVRAYARNNVGEVLGETVSFTTLSKKWPTMGSTSVTNVTTNSATLNGIVTSAGTSTVKERGFCISTAETPTIADSCIAVGSGIGSFNYTLTELDDGVTFYVRAYATSEVGTEYGETISFTTASAQLPIISTKSVSEITLNSATLYGQLESEGTSSVTEKGFCYSTTSQTPTLLDEHVIVNGSTIGSFSSVLTSLSEGTTYYFRAYATNNKGTAYGETISFTTQSLPETSTIEVSNITTNSAILRFNVISEGSSPVTEKGFCYSTKKEYPTIADYKVAYGSGIGECATTIASLLQGTTYYVRAYATNSNGTAYGETIWFTTKIPSLPTVKTNSSYSISFTTATISGIVSSDESADVTERGVCWGTTRNPTIENNKKASGSGIGEFSVKITSLSEGATYYARAYAINTNGIAYGEQITFTTLKTIYLPTVTIGTVSNVSYTTATISGSVTNDGGADVTERGICWATTSNPTISKYKQSSGSGTGSFSVSLSNLNEGTTYYVRAYAINSVGTAYGEQISFETNSYINSANIINGAIQAEFSVSETQKVYFSQGNLQYQASTNTWKFAERQYDMIGSKNKNISSTYDGWIDLFGYGTSGWNSGAIAYQPYSANTRPEDYFSKSLIGNYANADWGVYNEISNGGNQVNMWRTLTKDEWNYLIFERLNAENKYGVASVNGVNGLVLLPDNWTLPSNLIFNNGTAIIGGAGFFKTVNDFSVSEWQMMESNGAVFLPITNWRQGLDCWDRSTAGFYYSSSYNDNAKEIILLFFTSDEIKISYGELYLGRSVRLVQDVK